MDAHQPTWVHTGPHGCMQAHMDAQWSTWVHTSPHGCTLATWVQGGLHGCTQAHMNARNPTWMHAGPHEFRQAYMDAFRAIWMYTSPPECMLAHMSACRPAGGMMSYSDWVNGFSLTHLFSTGLHSLPAWEKLQALGGSTPSTAPWLVLGRFFTPQFLPQCIPTFGLMLSSWPFSYTFLEVDSSFNFFAITLVIHSLFGMWVSLLITLWTFRVLQKASHIFLINNLYPIMKSYYWLDMTWMSFFIFKNYLKLILRRN